MSPAVTPPDTTQAGGGANYTPEQQAAYDAMLKAVTVWAELCPKRPEPKETPKIRPVLMHASPGNFHLGYNMMLDAGGYMPGKIPVIVLPIRPEDIRKYKNKRTATYMLRSVGVHC